MKKLDRRIPRPGGKAMNTDYPYVDERDYNVQMAHEMAAAVPSHLNDDLDIYEMLIELDHGG